MQDRDIKIGDEKIIYQIRKSKKAKKIRITIYPDACVVVTQPRLASKILIERFVKQKSEWILKKIIQVKKNQDNNFFIKNSKEDYLKNKIKALDFVNNRLKFFNQIYNYKYNRVSIKNQKTRWGSCSSEKNLNFNYKLIYLPLKQADYIVVHELCHLKEMNHSKHFWNLVEKTFPDYKNIRKNLKMLKN